MNTVTKTRWRTAITEASAETVRIRGYDLSDLAEKVDFGAVFYLLSCGELPSPAAAKALNALMIAACDRGITPSSAITRTIASCGVPLQAAVAAGIISFGDIHGGVGIAMGHALKTQTDKLPANPSPQQVEDAAERFVAAFHDAGERVPGYGQPLHPQGDPRARRLIAYAQKLGVAGPALAVGLAAEGVLARIKGRSLPMNVDGAIACVALDIGMPPDIIRAINFVARAAGLSAHAMEETARERGFRLLATDDEVTYDGVAPRSL